jgi:hypothetical protein
MGYRPAFLGKRANAREEYTMASQLVVGIFPSSDVTSLETALGNVPGLDRGRLSVLTADSKTEAHEDSFLSFMHVAEEVEREPSPDITHGTGLLTDFGGTDVPGLTDSREPSLTDFEEPEVVPHYVGSLPIPSDEAENYDEAISEGRAVVVYPVSSDAERTQLQQALRAAGLRNVQAFATSG